MKPTKVLTLVVIVAVILIAVFSLIPSDSVEESTDYTATIEKHRAEQHEFMTSNPKSPFVEQKTAYNGLKFFPIDETFKTRASVEPIIDGKIYELATSDDKIKIYKEVAVLHFDLKGSHQDLTLLQATKDDQHYFLAFYDETSAITTYGSGRYLEIDYEKGQTQVSLDFNLAYNPYCAYTTGYSCPVPPLQNNITIPIEAGEKNYD